MESYLKLKYNDISILFCEALKGTRIQRLLLDGCGIDNWGLKQLAGSITGGCHVSALDTGWNSYTAYGLTEFLKILLQRFLSTRIHVLSTSLVHDENRKLVEEFNSRIEEGAVVCIIFALNAAGVIYVQRRKIESVELIWNHNHNL